MNASTNPKDLIGIEKPPISLVPPVSVIYEAMALRDGAAKYGPYNWRANKVQASIYIDAFNRHVMAWLDGEDFARDSGVHHLAHAKACLGIILDAEANGSLVDDRPQTGATSKVLQELTDFIKHRKAELC